MPDHHHDVAIILGAALREDGAPRPALIRRVAHGVALYHQGLVSRLLMSGGQVGGPLPEAWVMRDLALRQGVPADDLLIEDASRDTAENARLSLRLLAGRQERGRLLVITDAYHMRRALWIFRRCGAQVVGSAPEPPPTLQVWPARLREVCAFPVSAWKLVFRRD
jgi:uncharacterized SAM-binding protein YcdF (DUF218 family)